MNLIHNMCLENYTFEIITSSRFQWGNKIWYSIQILSVRWVPGCYSWTLVELAQNKFSSYSVMPVHEYHRGLFRGKITPEKCHQNQKNTTSQMNASAAISNWIYWFDEMSSISECTTATSLIFTWLFTNGNKYFYVLSPLRFSLVWWHYMQECLAFNTNASSSKFHQQSQRYWSYSANRCCLSRLWNSLPKCWRRLILHAHMLGLRVYKLCEDIIKWKQFPCYWPFVRGIKRLQRPGTRRIDIFFDLHLNKWLSKQLRRQLFETPSHSLWRLCNVSNLLVQYPVYFWGTRSIPRLLMHWLLESPGHQLPRYPTCRLNSYSFSMRIILTLHSISGLKKWSKFDISPCLTS